MATKAELAEQIEKLERVKNHEQGAYKQWEREAAQRAQKLNRANRNIKEEMANITKAAPGTLLVASIASGILGLLADATFTEDNRDAQNPTTEQHYINANLDILLSGYSYKYAKEHDMLWSFWANMIVTTVFFAAFSNAARKNTHKNELMKMIAQKEFTFENFEEAMRGASKNTVLDIIQNLSKADRQLFDNFLAHPDDIHKQELAIAVVRGHLMANPYDLSRLFKTFSPKLIPDEIRQAYETISKSSKKVMTWEQAVAKYNQGRQ